MNKKQNNLDQYKGENPFKVPDGYFENLTTQIMSQLPEKQVEPVKTISMMDRVRPWLYMAAVFIGLFLVFKAIVGVTHSEDTTGITQGQESLLVHTDVSNETLYDEDEEYLEYLENQYASYILAEELAFSE